MGEEWNVAERADVHFGQEVFVVVVVPGGLALRLLSSTAVLQRSHLSTSEIAAISKSSMLNISIPGNEMRMLLLDAETFDAILDTATPAVSSSSSSYESPSSSLNDPSSDSSSELSGMSHSGGRGITCICGRSASTTPTSVAGFPEPVAVVLQTAEAGQSPP